MNTTTILLLIIGIFPVWMLLRICISYMSEFRFVPIKYRIVKKTDTTTNRTLFRPQYRVSFCPVWFYFITDYTGSNFSSNFSSEDDARNFLVYFEKMRNREEKVEIISCDDIV